MGASGEIFRAKKRGKEHMKEQQKKKAAPVLVVLILIVLVGAAGVVSFLINRYKPGTEYMAGNEYFNLTDENSVALIQNGELLEEQAVLIGGEPYAAYTYVESQLNSCFYWDEETKGILLTTSGGVQTLLPGDAAVAKTPGGQPAVQQESDGTVYISLDVVKEYTDLDYAYYSDPNRVVIRNEWVGVEQATVQSGTAQVRQKGGIKSLIFADVQKGDTLLYLENLDNWCKVMTADGYIVTNAHVISGGKSCRVALSSGVTLEAKLVGYDEEEDLAVLYAETQTDLPTAEFGNSDLCSVGDTVYAIGNPLGVELRGTFTDGIISAINRQVEVEGKTMTLLQTNAALNNGNSGGPLINACGQVIGINTLKMSGTGSDENEATVEGLGFAIPMGSACFVVNDIIAYGEFRGTPSLGITVTTVAVGSGTVSTP